MAKIGMVNGEMMQRQQSGKPIALDEVFAQVRLKAWKSTGQPVKMLAENDGTVRGQLIGYDGSSQTRIKTETDGSLISVWYGKDSDSNLDPIRTNANQQLMFENVGYLPTRGVLGQSAPNAATETVVYTVPASTEADVTSIFITNENSAPVKVRLGVSVGGGALVSGEYLYYDLTLTAYQTLSWSGKVTLAAADELRIESDTANVSFSAFGVEYSPAASGGGGGSGTVTSVDVSGGSTGLTFSGGPVTSSGTITMAGTLAIANGGTGQTGATAAFDALSPLTTGGDIIYHDGANNVRLAKGSDGEVLTLASGVPSWAAAGGSGGPTLIGPVTTTRTTTSTSMADVTDLTTSISASTDYYYRFVIFWTTNATSDGMGLAVNGPASPTAVSFGAFMNAQNNSNFFGGSSQTADSPITSNVGPGATVRMAILEGIWQNGVNAGTLALRFRSEVGNAANILAGSYGLIWEL